jgi:FK506-binding nuclear protein
MGIFPTSVFGLTIQPGNAYTTTVEEDTHITMAAISKFGSKRTSVVIKINDSEFTLCALTPGKHENQQLNIYLNEDDEVTFTAVGDSNIDLTGNTVAMMIDNNEQDFDEEDMMDEEDALMGLEGDEEIDSDEAEGILAMNGASDSEGSEGESDDEEEMEFDEALLTELNKRKLEPIPVNNKRAKITEVVEEPTPKKVEQKKEVKKAEPKKEVKEVKTPEVKKVKEVKTPEVEKETPEKRTLPSGLVIEDRVIGNGPRAKPGKKVAVRYVGKLMNGKVFDSNTKGAPFTFKLGKGEVIKGWDLGVAGMNVGGERKLTIPSKLAYGSRGAPPDIPKNADLVFEVKLLEVKQ